MPSQFVHLHLHTDYSLLDGANQLTPLLNQVREFGQQAVAMTDHGNLFGAIEFYQKAKSQGVKPIIGCEAYLAPGSRKQREGLLAHNDYYHLILLATNLKGYHNLIKLSSKAYLEGFYYKPRVDKELLQEHHDGIIALSGCLSGEVPYLIGQNDIKSASQKAGEYQEIFGKDYYYLEVQANGLPQQLIANRGLIEIHKKLNIPLAGTNDCHYLKKEDARPHEIMLCLQTGKSLKDTNRLKFDTDQLYVKSTDEMVAEFTEIPEAILSTCQISEKCNLELPFGTSYLPYYQVPEGFTRESYLQKLAEEGLIARLKTRPPSIPKEAYDLRLKEEIAVLTTMGYAGYFLIVWDIIKFARSRGIPVGPGRGSAAGSLIAYALFITDLDPLAYNLLFERFLNPERVSMPDIDIDFCMDRRSEVINYVIDRYGEDHVCQIITFGTLGAKAAIRDVGRVMDIPYAEVDRIAKLVPPQLNITLKDALAQEPQLQELIESDSRIKDLMNTAKSLEGLARHASTHAAGVVISQEPLMEHIPLYKSANNEIVTQYSMTDIENVGLVKFDFLGLKTLTMIHHAVTLVNQRATSGQTLNLDQLSLNDSKTFALLTAGKTTGLFQLESSGMRNVLVRIKPEYFEDLIAILALYRPGPIESGMIEDFIERKQDHSKIRYDPVELEPILKETYGVIVYQEQVMAIANHMAGFSLGQADLLRRAMGKKKPEEMVKQKEEFVNGAIKNKFSKSKAEKLFDKITYFAGYGFNKSHSAAYAMIAYQTGYLKANYPTEFMAALLTSEMGNTDKMVGYFNECRELGITILPPDVNESHKNFNVVENGIRFGLAAIKNVGVGGIESIIASREKDGPFISFLNFCSRIDLKKVNKRVLEGLIKVGAFDSMQVTRSQLMANMEETLGQASAIQHEQLLGQTNLFETMKETTPLSFTESRESGLHTHMEEWSQEQLLQYERQLTGFFISAHPLTYHAETMKKLCTHDTRNLNDIPDGKEIKICGIIGNVKHATTKKGDHMAYVQLEDLQGLVEVIVFPELFKNCSNLVMADTLVHITGIVDKMDTGSRIKAKKIVALHELKTKTVKRVTLHLKEQPDTWVNLRKLQEVLQRHPGSAPISFQFHLSSNVEVDSTPIPNITVLPTEHLINDIEKILGKESVVFHHTS